MPTENENHLEPDQMHRIINISSSKGNDFKSLEGNKIHAQLVYEIDLDFMRTMNQLMFDNEITVSQDTKKYAAIELPQRTEVLEISYFGRVEMPDYNLELAQKNFAFASLLTKLEVVCTMSKIRVECDKLANTGLFNLNYIKTVKLDEFEQTQVQSLQNVKGGLKDGWINVLKTAIKNGFKEVGKGWYNMLESNFEVYKISKLRKFMTSVKFIMQDSLRTMVISSIGEFVKSLKSITSQNVTINGPNDVKISPSSKNEATLKRPLFLVDLAFKSGKLQYNIDLELFESTLLGLFDRAITTPDNLPQLEPLVLDQMFWATKPTLQTVNARESVIIKCRKSLLACIREGTAPLDTYINQFDRHLKLLNLDISSFAAEYEANEPTLETIQQDISRLTKEWESLDKEIPSHISLGLFWVNCEMIRTAMRKDLSKVILELLSKRAGKLASTISQGFLHIYNKLKDKPTKIEELIDLRNYIDAIPMTFDILEIQVKEMLDQYDVLDSHRFESSNEDMRARWAAFGWPAKAKDLLSLTETQMLTDESIFGRQLQTDQEVFKDRIHTLTVVIAEFGKHGDLSRSNEIVNEVSRVVMELKEVQSFASLFNSRERLFNLEPTRYDEVAQLTKDFEPYKTLWLTANDWSKWKDQWMLGSFTDLNAEEVERNLSNAWRNVFKSVKVFKNVPGPLNVANYIKNEMDEFKPFLPLIQALRNPGMRDRHWDRLSDELGINFHPDSTFTLAGILQMNLLERVETISKVCDVAGKEYSIEEALDKMDSEWKTIELEIISYKDTGTYIMKASDDTIRLLDDHIVMAQSMGFSPYKKPFVDRISQWESKLKIVQEVIESWMACQRSWLYLEPIFGSDDIANQLPVESKRFITMDRTWRKIMSSSKSKPGVVDFCADLKLLDSFHECNKLLEQVAKGLSAYLESKRVAFPRFFFLSDDELLQILSQTKDPTAVQPHLRKCFENVASLEFAPDNKIMAMYSGEGERIALQEPFYPKGPVEEWLLHVEDQMRKSVKRIIEQAIQAYPNRPRTNWVLEWPGQAVLAGSQTFWTQEVTEAFSRGDIKTLLVRLLSQLQGLVALVRGDLPFLNRLVLGDLIVVEVHSRDVVKKLIDNNILSDKDFDWISQLRYYWEEDDLRVKIVNANFK